MKTPFTTLSAAMPEMWLSAREAAEKATPSVEKSDAFVRQSDISGAQSDALGRKATLLARKVTLSGLKRLGPCQMCQHPVHSA